MNKRDIIRQTKRLLRCDTVRVWQSEFSQSKFVIIGTNRHSTGEWFKSEGGEFQPVEFDYVAETVIASGEAWNTVWASVKEYKRLTRLTMSDYLMECARPAWLGGKGEDGDR